MARFVFGLSLADRPGALGAVASRIGALGGDLVDIDVLDRSNGIAHDELTVDLASEEVATIIAAELAALEGVGVEQVTGIEPDGHQLLVDSLEVAGALVAEREIGGLLDALVTGVVAAFTASWSAVLVQGRPRPLAEAGSVPPASVIRADPILLGDLEDQVAVELGSGEATLVVGREGWPFRARERRELGTLARIAGERWLEVAENPVKTRS